MDYEVDLDPVHSVIRLTLTTETVTVELAEEILRHLSGVASRGGPYAAIYDFSAVKRTIPTEMGVPVARWRSVMRTFARRRPCVPMGKKHVIVGKEPLISRLASVFQMCSESIGEPAGFVLGRVSDTGEIREFQVVYSLEEAYDILGARPEDFTVCFPPFGQVSEST